MVPVADFKSTAEAVEPTSRWSETAVQRILASRLPSDVARFRRLPIADKLIALQNAVVPPKRDETADKLVTLIKELVNLGAIRAEEAGGIYSDLLIRVHKFNGANAQSALDALAGAVRSAQSEAIRNTDVKALSNQRLLNQLFARLPSPPSGHENFEAFKQTLRLFCNEAPNATLYMSGGDVVLQVNIRGVNTVNVTSAFKALHRLWGVDVDGEHVPQAMLSSLTSNARVLMLLMAPFTNTTTFTPDSLIALLFAIYRDTVSASLERTEETEAEVERTARDLGISGLDLQNTLGYLLRSREPLPATENRLSPRQEQVLRFMQESLVDRIDRAGMDPAKALDTLHLAFAPSAYGAHARFIRRMTTYMLMALQSSPDYFREIYSNKYWLPPKSFWTRDYSDFFEDVRAATVPLPPDEEFEDDLEWDDGDEESGRIIGRYGGDGDSEESFRSFPSSMRTTMGSDAHLRMVHGRERDNSLWGGPPSPITTTAVRSAMMSQAPSFDPRRLTERRRERIAREQVRQRLRQINEASNAIADLEESSDTDDIQLGSLFGDGAHSSHIRFAGTEPEASGNTLPKSNLFAHLAPRNGSS